MRLDGAERERRLLHLAVELDQHRLHRADDERQRDEQQRQQHGELRERDVDADRAGRAVEREQREAGDDRRQRERQVDQRVDEALAAELVAHEDPGDQRAGDGVDHASRRARRASVNRSAATAWRLLTALQNASKPPSVERTTTAASGSSTIRLSQSVEMPSAEGARPAGRAPAGSGRACSLGGRHSRVLLDLGDRAALDVEQLGVDLLPAAEVLDREQAGRVGELVLVGRQDLLVDRPVAPARRTSPAPGLERT